MSIQYGLVSPEQLEAFMPLLPENEIISDTGDNFFVGAVKDDTACGIMYFRANDFIVSIQHIAVAPDFRRQGIANGMIDFICECADSGDAAVLATFAAENDELPICQLLAKRDDFVFNVEENYVCRIPCNELDKVNLPDKLPDNAGLTLFYNLPEHQQFEFFNELSKDNFEIVRNLKEEKDSMLKPLCLCVISGGSVKAAIFCQQDENAVTLAFAYSSYGHSRSLMALLSRLKELLMAAAETVPYLYIAAVIPESRKLVDAIFPDREIISHFYTAQHNMKLPAETENEK